MSRHHLSFCGSMIRPFLFCALLLWWFVGELYFTFYRVRCSHFFSTFVPFVNHLLFATFNYAEYQLTLILNWHRKHSSIFRINLCVLFDLTCSFACNLKNYYFLFNGLHLNHLNMMMAFFFHPAPNGFFIAVYNLIKCNNRIEDWNVKPQIFIFHIVLLEIFNTMIAFHFQNEQQH